MSRLLHSSVGAEGSTVTTRTQALLVPQHWSMACQSWKTVWVQPVLVITLSSRVTTTLLQQASIQSGGLVGMGLPQAMTRLLHSSVGADGRILIARRQLLLVPQHWSMACQSWKTVWVQPLLVIVVSSRVTTTLLQQASIHSGALVGMGLPQAMTRLPHSSVGADGRILTARTQALLVPQHWSTACQSWKTVWVQPLLVIVVSSRVTTTLLQQASIHSGALVGMGLPQAMTRLPHSSVGADGRILTARTQA